MAPMKGLGPRGRAGGKIEVGKQGGRHGIGQDSEGHRGAAIHIILPPWKTPTAASIFDPHPAFP